MTTKVTKDELENVLVAVKLMAKKSVLIGIPAPENDREDGEPIGNAELGFLHDHGSPAQNIPARPFLLPGVKDARDKIAAVLKPAAAAAITNPAAIDKGLNAAGLVAVAAVKARIVSGEGFPPLAPETVAARKRKGFSGESPLIRTGQLLNSITFVLRGERG